MESLIVLIVAAIIYFLPFIVARQRRKVSLVGIFILNLLFGWTIIGWLIIMWKALSTSTADQLHRGINVNGLSNAR